MKYLKLILPGLAALLLASCATLNKEECMNANWRTIGYEDGTKGYPASRIGEHRKACAEYNIRPDLNAYTEGRKKGLRQFCTPTMGYRKGSQGYNYTGVCRGYNEPAFLEAYNYGRQVYKEQQRLNNLRSKYSRQLRYIDDLQRSLHEKEELMVSGRLSKAKALILLNETRDMAEEVGRAKSYLNELSAAIDDQARRVRHMKEESGY